MFTSHHFRLAAATAILCATASAQFTFTLAQTKTAGDNGPPCGPFINGGAITINMTYTTVGNVGAVPVNPQTIHGNGVGFPTYSGEFYDEDVAFHDCVTPVIATATMTPWTLAKTNGPDRYGRVQWVWTASFTEAAPGQICDCSDFPGFNPADPYLDITLTIGGVSKTQSIAVPGLPTVGNVDIGLQGPSTKTTVGPLAERRIAAFSRGYDDISSIGNGAALYFASDTATQQSTIPGEAGRLFVLDDNGDLWPESAYAASFDQNTNIECELEFLNVNTTPMAGGPATGELYFVARGTDRIQYSTGNPSNTSLYLDLATSTPIEAIAVQDVAPRGQWSAGDEVLFAMVGDSSIWRLSHGGTPVTLNLSGIAFDGSTTILMDHFADITPQPQLTVGNILAMSVTARSTSTPQPPDRAADFLAEFCEASSTLSALWAVSGTPSGIAHNPTTDTTYLVYGNHVDVYDSTGTMTGTFGLSLSNALAATVDPATGNVWIADASETIYELLSNGTPTGRSWSTTADVPDLRAIAWQPETGSVFAGDGSGEFVVRYDLNGNALGQIDLRSPRVDVLGALAYDPVRRTLIVGDATYNRAVGVDLDGHVRGCWTLNHHGLPVANGMAYDASTRTLLALASPFVAELSYIPDHAVVNVLPTACVGPAGPLVLTDNTLPTLGNQFESTTSGFAAGTLGYAVVGFSSPGIALNLIHPAGLPGCDQLASLHFVQLMLPAGGNANYQIFIPNHTSLAGIHLFHQAFQIQFSGGGGLMSLSSSNGLDLLLGY